MTELRRVRVSGGGVLEISVCASPPRLRPSGRSRGLAGLARMGLAIAVLASIPTPTAWAHKMIVFAAVQDGKIQGEVYYQDGSPAQRVKVAILGPGGGTLGAVDSDDDGKFVYQPRVRCAHTFVADGGFGHRAEYTLPAAQLPTTLPTDDAGQPEPQGAATAGRTDAQHVHPAPAGSQPELAAEIGDLNRQIVALRADLEKWKSALRLQDVLGGVGYIFGILGGLSYFLRGRRTANHGDRV